MTSAVLLQVRQWLERCTGAFGRSECVFSGYSSRMKF